VLLVSRGAVVTYTEQTLQRAVIEHLQVRGAPGIFWWHTPNGGYRRPREAKIFKSLGVKAGIPDLMIIHEGRIYGLELKAEGGRATPKQLAAVEAIRNAGGFACIAEGLDRALACLEAWKILKGWSE
jgi:hypothetical protein